MRTFVLKKTSCLVFPAFAPLHLCELCAKQYSRSKGWGSPSADVGVFTNHQSVLNERKNFVSSKV
jgi:hypothetical protein